MITAYICSPYAGDVEGNVERAKIYCKNAIFKGAMPVASHLLYPQFLNDNDPAERNLGMSFAVRLLSMCDQLWVFGDTVSKGMKAEITFAEECGIPIRYFSDAEL